MQKLGYNLIPEADYKRSYGVYNSRSDHSMGSLWQTVHEDDPSLLHMTATILWKKATNACNAVAGLCIMRLNNKPIAGIRELISNFA